MITEQHRQDFDRLRPYCQGKRMLMLGRQESTIGDPAALFGCAEYRTLDPDRGDYPLDLCGDLADQHQKWDVVFNLGTIEHIWDVHRAYSNAASLVRIGGYFLGHAPVRYYDSHGIHVTSAAAIMRFFAVNGFEHVEHWLTGRVLLWHVEKKMAHQDLYQSPQQIYNHGRPAGIQ